MPAQNSDMTTAEKTTLFIPVLDAHKGIIYKVANSYCKNPDDRQDLVQEIILQLWNSFEKYDSRYKHSTWIYRIAINHSISFYRKENTRKAISKPLSDNLMQFNFEDPTQDQELESNLNLLQTFINELKELDKALMILYLEDKSYKEIAEIIGITETNVATKLSRIKEKLKEKFTLKNT